MVLKIVVKTLDSQNYQFEAQDDWTVSQFKDHIKDTVNVAPEEQRLIFCGRVLQNDKKLTEYDCHEKVMHLVRRPPPSADEPERRTSANENTHDDSGSSSRAGSFRLGEGHDILLSTMTLGPDGSINDLWRQIVSLQQTIHANNQVIDEERATLASNLDRLGADVDRRLNNLARLTRITTAQIAECYSRIGQISSSGSSIPRTPVIAAASSHTDLSSEFDSQPTDSNNTSVPERTGSFTSSTSTDRTQERSNDSANQQQQQRRVSLTTDDLPSATHFRANRTLNNLVRSNRSVTSTPLSNSQPGDTMLDRYVSLLDYSNTLQGQIQTLTGRYREVLLMSRRGGLIVTDRSDEQAASDQSQNSSANQNQEQSSSRGSPTGQLSTVFMQEARIFTQYIPRIMHTYSHVLHALSDFSVDVTNGRLVGPTPTMGTVLPYPRVPIVRGTVRQTARRSHPPDTPPQAQTASRTPSAPLMESSVTITATTVDATPLLSTSTTTLSGQQQPQTSATIVVTSDSGQADVHIPISIPSGSFEPLDIHMNFSTPQVPPPTQEHSRDSSASRQRDSNQQSAPDEQNNQRRQQPTQQQERSRQETTSTQTSSAARPYGIVTSRIPAHFDLYLICNSPFATSNGLNRGQVRQSIGVIPEARVQFRVPTMRPMPAGPEPHTNQTQAAQQGASPNPTLNAGLTEVVNNILESIFRPTDSQPVAQSGSTQTSQDNNQTGQSSHDPILNMIPELAINAATQMLSGVLGIQTQQPQARSTNNAANQQQNQPRARPQVPVMMDIDIDDSSSSHSESRYHDASDSNRPAIIQNLIAPQQSQSFSLSAQPPTTSQQVTPSSGLSARRPVVTSSQRINYNREQLTEVMRHHPDWLPIIEADINFMGQQSESGVGSSTYFSDAYLSSVPRKRRRLLTATPDRVLILQPSPSEAITNLLRRAVTNSHVQADIESLDSMFASIANDQELQAAYEDHIKSTVEARLRSDCDYKPEKFENSRKYFNP